mmetsp:Transcript_12884/g.30170  ORF Transcript_12884/g.30170 Transcript_12884/m.30170 type:complete len:295 (+) Transcript_12884:113-997(+)
MDGAAAADQQLSWDMFLETSDQLKNDASFMRDAVHAHGERALWHASEALLDDYSFSTMVVAPYPDTLRLFSLRVQQEAVCRDPPLLRYASDGFRSLSNNEWFVLHCVREEPRVLLFAPDLRNNREFVAECFALRPEALHFADASLLASERFMKELRREHPEALSYFSSGVQMNAVRDNPRELKYASLEVQWTAVRNNPHELRYALEIQDDEDEVLIAVMKHPHVFQYATERLRCNPSFVAAAIEIVWRCGYDPALVQEYIADDRLQEFAARLLEIFVAPQEVTDPSSSSTDRFT